MKCMETYAMTCMGNHTMKCMENLRKPKEDLRKTEGKAYMNGSRLEIHLHIQIFDTP